MKRSLGYRIPEMKASQFYKVEESEEVNELKEKTVVIEIIPTDLKAVDEGETIETRVIRILNDKTPIEDTAPILYTDAKNGVNKNYDVRTDIFEEAIDELSDVHRSQAEKYQQSISKTLSEGGGTPPEGGNASTEA